MQRITCLLWLKWQCANRALCNANETHRQSTGLLKAAVATNAVTVAQTLLHQHATPSGLPSSR